jgi:hypothetical protein
MKRVYTLLFAFLLIPASTINATTIVVILGPNYVSLGADSKGVTVNKKTMQVTSGSVCKIYQTGKYYFAYAGMGADPDNNYIPENIISEYLGKANSRIVAIDSLMVALKKAMRKEYLHLKKFESKSYHSSQLKDDLLDLAIIGFENGKPFAEMVLFKMVDSNLVKISVTHRPILGIAILGSKNAIVNYLNNPSIAHYSSVQEVEKLIDLEVNEFPDRVGLPLDIVELLPDNKVYWYKQKPGCPFIYAN